MNADVGILLIKSLEADGINRAYSLLLIFGAGTAIVNAQPPTPGAPPPATLFSEATIKSFTPAGNPITDAKPSNDQPRRTFPRFPAGTIGREAKC